MGYAGGKQANPDYGHIGDHTETVQVDFDPQRIAYNQLLDIFWQSHKPTSQSWSRQYKNAVFYHNEQQRQLAMNSKMAMEKKLGRQVKTDIASLRTFTMAEDYHQKYLLKHTYDLNREMTRIYPVHRELVDSTAAARLNGYAGGNGSKKQLAGEIDDLGLTDAGRKALTQMVKRK